MQDDAPSWLKNPDYERLGFMNDIIVHLWPHIAASASVMVRDLAEPILHQSKPKCVVPATSYSLWCIRVRVWTQSGKEPLEQVFHKMTLGRLQMDERHISAHLHARRHTPARALYQGEAAPFSHAAIALRAQLARLLPWLV